MCAAEPSALDPVRHANARTTRPMTGPASGHPDGDVGMPSFDGEPLAVLRDTLQVPALHLFASVGSTLDVAHRPGRCVLYLCDTLRRELHTAGQLGPLELMLTELQGEMTELIGLHKARVDRETLAPLVAALEDYARR